MNWLPFSNRVYLAVQTIGKFVILSCLLSFSHIFITGLVVFIGLTGSPRGVAPFLYFVCFPGEILLQAGLLDDESGIDYALACHFGWVVSMLCFVLLVRRSVRWYSRFCIRDRSSPEA